MLFSVITVTKNNPHGFARTRQRVMRQDFTDFEWVVVDGAIEPDAGIYDAMNKGIARAQGEFLIFMNAGDCFVDTRTLSAIARYADTGDVLYGDAVEAGRIKRARHDIRYGMVTHHQAIAYRRGTLRYDTRYTIAADYKFTVQAMRDARVVHMPFAVCDFEVGGISQRRVAQGRREQAMIRRELRILAPGASAMQMAASALRRVAPDLYWRLRARA